MYRRGLIALCLYLLTMDISRGTEMPKPAGLISKQSASRIALSKVPGGVIETAKLEKEGNKTIWSVDVKMPASKSITEVHIEADTGKVISVTVETPEQQAAEAAADKKKSTAH